MAMPESAYPIDTVILARRCATLMAQPRSAQAVAISGDRIVAVGSRRQIRARATRRTRIIDLGDGVVTPGLIDCHTHFFYWALQRALVIDLSDTRSSVAAVERIRKQAPRRSVDGWVLGLGFDQNQWNEGFPTADQLDRAVPDRPAIVRSRDGHTAWLNHAGLRLAGITHKSIAPKGGRYLRDGRGVLTGIVQETAVDQLPDPLRDLAQRSDREALKKIDKALRQAYAWAWKHGFVGVHSVDDACSLTHLQRHRVAGQLGLRVVHSIPVDNVGSANTLGLRSGLGDDWLRVGGVKIFADGALGSQTAYMLDPYPGSSDVGVAVVAGEQLRDIVVSAAEAGLVAWIHAIGDRAVREAIDAITAARRVANLPMPYRIEHAQCVRPGDIRRMARQGIVASVQPGHILGDIVTADRHWPQARRHAYAFRRMLDAGVTLACGSDVPVDPLDPRRGLYGAVNRQDESGNPPAGWFPEQRLTVEETLHAYTIGARRSVGEDPANGRIRAGAPADLTLWRTDPLRATSDELLNLDIGGCVVGGIVHGVGLE